MLADLISRQLGNVTERSPILQTKTNVPEAVVGLTDQVWRMLEAHPFRKSDAFPPLHHHASVDEAGAR